MAKVMIMFTLFLKFILEVKMSSGCALQSFNVFVTGIPIRPSTRSLFVKLICQYTRYFAKFVIPVCMGLSCTMSGNLPVNVVWLEEKGDGLTTRSQGFAVIVLRLLFLFLPNSFAWSIIAIGGYGICVDILIGSVTLSYCQRLVYRYVNTY